MDIHTITTAVPGFLHAAYTVLMMCLCMAIIILIHEGGHWFVARCFGMKTPVFSIGFGKRQWSLVLGRFWDTEFRLSPIPLGGYVSLPEMQDETTAKSLLEKNGGDPNAIRVFPVWQRIAVAMAGVTFNMISALVALVLVFHFLGVPVTKVDSTAVSTFSNTVKVAQDAGFQKGDRFLSVGGKPLNTPEELNAALGRYKGRSVPVVVLRGSETKTIDVTPDASGHIGVGLAVSAHQIYVPVPTVQAAKTSVEINETLFLGTLKGFGMMLGVVQKPADIPASALEVRGIVGIVQMGASAYGQGFFNFVIYLVIISINLVIMNSLPLPLLDGGHVVFFLWEKVSGKPVSAKLKGQLYRVFFALLIALFAFGLLHDVQHIIRGN